MTRWLSGLASAAAVAAALTCLGLALLWLLRNPGISAWDELGHLNHSMADALLLRASDFGALRDSLFLEERWLPPGLRLVGLPIAALFPGDPAMALRIAAGVLFAATAAALYLGIRPFAGSTGAAAGVAFYALSPTTLFGAQNFMTESILNLCAAVVLSILAREAAASRASLPRLVALAAAMGLGALTKLTFLPALGPAWMATAALGWWRTRDTTALALRLLVPATGILVIAWPHYALNGMRYIGYAHATAGGFAFTAWTETGLDFLWRAMTTLVSEVFGPGGALLLLAALALALLAWRRSETASLTAAGFGLLAAAPALGGFFLSNNQTTRYLGLCVVAFAFPVGVALGAAVRAANDGARATSAGLAIVVLATFAQVGATLFVAARGPLQAEPLTGVVAAVWRPNPLCDYAPVVSAVPGQAHPPRIGVFGLTQAVNHVTLLHAFLRAGILARVIELENTSARTVDWPRVMAELRHLDLLAVPESTVVPSGMTVAGPAVNAGYPELMRRLAEGFTVQEIELPSFLGPSPECRLRLLAIHPQGASTARLPLLPEVPLRDLQTP